MIGTLIKVFYTKGPNLVILAWTGPKLDAQTERRRQLQYPKAKTGLG